jgi:hypothetical protein
MYGRWNNGRKVEWKKGGKEEWRKGRKEGGRWVKKLFLVAIAGFKLTA